ncbi:MAG: NAD(P)/FAD-dependent oxidoreductase [Acidobacteria bacterium]|nr:NAD(P)/FAD-dependent oxidoreductase [Acidobacteriota bacterium]
MAEERKTRVVVLGGGFAGVYAAMELERALGRDASVEITLVNRENFFLFTPMLHEVAASDLDLTHIVNPIRKLLTRASFFHGRVLSIDLEGREVQVSHGPEATEQHPHTLPFDHLVLALGGVTNFYGLPGLEERALTMKSLGDAIALRNRLIENLEEADFECCPDVRRRMMTFVVAGGGFAGVETVAAINDFVRDALKFYPNLRETDVRMVLVHAGDGILPELSRKLGAYALEKLSARGVEMRLGTRVQAFESDGVRLGDGTLIATRTLVWTAGTSPNPLLAPLPLAKERGRVVANEFLEVPGHPGVWALGDCAVVPDRTTGGSCPPTAQHASRQGKILARNIAAAIRGGRKRPFVFRTIGQLAAIGRRSGVASILGVNFSGFLAWWMWRTIYLSKLPRLERKIRVAIDWTLDLVFTKDLVQCPTARGHSISGDPSLSTHPQAREPMAVIGA